MSEEASTLRWALTFPEDGPDQQDFVLKSGGMTIGRVHNRDPAARGRWTWSLTVQLGRGRGEAGIKEWSGEEPSRAEAVGRLKAAWAQWLEWAGLKQG
ncbi:MAG TPA: hypothetical protein VIL65_04185 [Beijerinckiaceae bacterium]